MTAWPCYTAGITYGLIDTSTGATADFIFSGYFSQPANLKVYTNSESKVRVYDLMLVAYI